MLNTIASHEDYLSFLDSELIKLSFSDHKRFKKDKSLKSASWRLRQLNLDPIEDIFRMHYSQYYGRPARDPTVTFRSFVLMSLLKFSSIEHWCEHLLSDPICQILIGTLDPPGLACHYDFINRFLNVDPHLSELYPANKYSKKNKNKLKKDEKWENFTDEDTRSLKDKYWNGATFDRDRITMSLEWIFQLLAVQPSIDRGLIPKENAVFSGDGSALHIHSSPFGNKVSNPSDDQHTHRYTAPDADIGWDSDLEQWYLGYTLYNISHHNKDLRIDLPVFLTLNYASTNDALTTLSATADWMDLNPDIKPSYMCFDSAMDAYNIYEYLRHIHIIPIIDWNKRHSGSNNPYAKFENLDSDGTPICMANHRMIRDGYDTSKMATKYRCPLAMGKIDSCPLKDKCSPSPYGRVIKTYDKTNLKLFSPVPYQSDLWKEIYKERTCTERINNRILNDYGLHNLKVRNRSKNFFFMIMAGINIHMDAWAKCSKK